MAARGLISFDAAGTLIRVARPVAAIYAEIASAHGVAVTSEALKPAFRAAWSQLPAPLHPEGAPPEDDDRTWWKQLVRRVFAASLGTPLDEEVLSPLFDDLYQHYAKPEAWVIYDDVIPALDLLRDQFDLCVLSNFDRRLYSILQGHGLTPYFGAIIISSEVGASKPHPRMFTEAERQMSASAATILHTGDDEKNDVFGAQNAGWKAWHVQRPHADLQILAEKVLSEAI